MKIRSYASNQGSNSFCIDGTKISSTMFMILSRDGMGYFFLDIFLVKFIHEFTWKDAASSIDTGWTKAGTFGSISSVFITFLSKLCIASDNIFLTCTHCRSIFITLSAHTPINWRSNYALSHKHKHFEAEFWQWRSFSWNPCTYDIKLVHILRLSSKIFEFSSRIAGTKYHFQPQPLLALFSS